MATLRKNGKLIEQDEPQEQDVRRDPDINVQAAVPVQPTDPATDMLVTLGTMMAQPQRRDDAAVETAKAELQSSFDLAMKVMADLQPVVQKHAQFISQLRAREFEPEGDGYVKLRRMTTGAAVSYDKIAALERSVTELMRIDTAAPARAVREIDNITAEDLKARPGLNYWRDLAQFVEHLPETYEAYVAQVKSDLAVVFAMLKATDREGLADTWEIARPDSDAPSSKPQIGFDVFNIPGVDSPRETA